MHVSVGKILSMFDGGLSREQAESESLKIILDHLTQKKEEKRYELAISQY